MSTRSTVTCRVANQAWARRRNPTAVGPSLTERVARRTGAEVAKAFNCVTQPCGPPARRALGREGVHVGGAVQACQLEQTAALVIRLLFAGAAPTTAFGLIGLADGAP